MKETSKWEMFQSLWPDSRGWCAMYMFALAWRLLWMIDNRPELLESAPFMGIAGGTLGAGGVGLIMSFHYASSSGTAKANERTDQVLAAMKPEEKK